MRYLYDAKITKTRCPPICNREGEGSNSKVFVMLLARFFDRIAALLILAMGSSIAAAFVTVTG